MSPIDVDLIAQRIQSGLDLVSTEALDDWPGQVWTMRVKDAVGRVAKSMGWEVYASQLPIADDGEWLFDLIAMTATPDGHISTVAIAMESEWGPSRQAFDDDFQKLLVARAELRIFIFEATALEHFAELIDHFVRQIRDFTLTLTGDRYLFAAWIDARKGFAYHSYVHGRA